MKLLIDACVWAGDRAELKSAGHDVVWVADWAADPGDAELLSRAYDDGRTLVTMDKDFGELAIVYGTPHCGILRLVGVPATRQMQACVRALETHGRELAAGGIVTVERGRVRVRPAND